MTEVLGKAIAAIHDHRPDMVLKSLGYFAWKLLGIIFSKTHGAVWGSAFCIGAIIAIARMGTIGPTDELPWAEIAKWTLVSYPIVWIVALVSALVLILKDKLEEVGQEVEQYQPRKPKENPVFSHESLTALLDDNPSANYTLSDDGELVPVPGRKQS